MRLWLNRSTDISLRDQLTTQVRLGILCRELRPGEKLPSTRELARRFGIHANTASAAYGELERDGWLEFRHGSGVYVRATRPVLPRTPELAVEFKLDELIGELVVKARKAGAAPGVIRERMLRWLEMEPPGRWLVIEPDPELREILLTEIRAAVGFPVDGCAPEDCARGDVLDGAMPLVLPSKAAMVRTLLASRVPESEPGAPTPSRAELTVLQVHPVAPALGGYLPAPAGVLVGVASRWEEFQRVARIMLIAAGIPPESLVVRDATKPGWKRGLAETSGVVCDAVTCAELPKGCRAIEFRLIAEESLGQLREAEASY